MRPANVALNDKVSSRFQIAENAPSIVVYVRQRYWNHRDLWDGKDIDGTYLIDPSQEWYQLTNRVLSIDVQEDVEQFASQFTITFSNEEGELAPDNYSNKFPQEIKFRGTNIITYAQQLLPDNEIMVYLGYGEELVPYIRGFVSEPRMNTDDDSIAVTCMTAYKHLIHQTIDADVLKAPDGNLYDVLKFFFDKAGVELKGQKMYVPGTNEEWIIKGAKGERGQSYDEVIRDLIDTTVHYIKCNIDGTCTLMQIPRYMPDDPADVIFDEGVNATSLEYVLTDQDVYNTVTVKCGNHKSRWSSSFLLQDVCLGIVKEEVLDVPWADTYRKQREVAVATHLKNFHKWKTANLGVVGDPRLELWDKVGVREQTSSLTDVFHIKGIQTSISDSGFFQILDLSPNYGFGAFYGPKRHIDYLTDKHLVVNVSTIRLKLWDWDVQDGDVINIYCNDELVKSNYMIKNDPDYVDIPLDVGDNIIVFEGVSCAKGILTGRLQVLDTSNHILFDVGSLPDLTFPRTNINKNGVYTKRPNKAMVVTRQS